MLNLLRTLLRVPRVWCFWLSLLSLAVAPCLRAQTAQQEEDLPADDIIEILQQNPEILAEAKAEIVAQLRDRGYPVTDRTLTDDRLFSEIRSDDRARHAMSEELKKRGFGVEQESAQQSPAQGQTQNQPSAVTLPNNGAGQPLPQNGATAGQPSTPPRARTARGSAR